MGAITGIDFCVYACVIETNTDTYTYIDTHTHTCIVTSTSTHLCVLISCRFILLRVHHLSALSPGRALKSWPPPRFRDHGIPSTQISFQDPSPSKAQGFLGEKPDLSSEAAEVLANPDSGAASDRKKVLCEGCPVRGCRLALGGRLLDPPPGTCTAN